MEAKGLGKKGNSKKSELIDRIFGQQDLVEETRDSVEGMLIQKWFLRPLKDKNLTYGTMNEPKIRLGLKKFLEEACTQGRTKNSVTQDCDGITLEEIHEIGLVSKNDVRYLDIFYEPIISGCV